MMLKETALSIAKRACPSISYRIKKEILHEDVSHPEMIMLQEKILHEDEILRVFSLRKENGWLGGRFHGVDEPECCIRFLIEKGVEPSHPIIQDALYAIVNAGEQFDEGSMCNVGKPLDALHFGGSKLMKACVFAYTGKEDNDFVSEQIEEALHVFRYVYSAKEIADVCEMHRNTLIFKQGVMWPSIYHLRLLAYTTTWKNSQNKEMLVKAMTNLARLSPIPPIKLRYKSQIISPASVYMNHFKEDMNGLTPKEWMLWFHRTELIARLGIASSIPSIKTQIEYVHHMLAENNGLFTKKLRHSYYTKWTQYVGLALEENWRSDDKAINDLTFRCLLILSLTHGNFFSSE